MFVRITIVNQILGAEAKAKAKASYVAGFRRVASVLPA